MENDTLPVAETFTSIHGEGFWAGTRMTFFRLAGCSVGKFLGTSQGRNPDHPQMPILPSGAEAWECTAFDGRKFPCDTDFRKAETRTLDELAALIPKGVKHVCITGGEPLMHSHTLLSRLISKLSKKLITTHIETSGTIQFGDWLLDNNIYIACSPKGNYLAPVLNKVDEVRLMVDEKFDVEAARKLMSYILPKCHVFLAPLSYPQNVSAIDPASMAKCLELMKKPPFQNARISLQLHKILGVR